jgi:hypothetical protein
MFVVIASMVGLGVTPAIYLTLKAIVTAALFWQRTLVSAAALASILAGIPCYYICGSGERFRVNKEAQERKPAG